MASTLPKLPIFEAISKHDLSSTAVIDSGSNQAFSYGTLLRDVVAAKQHLSQTVSGSPLCGERVAFLAENGYNYVVTFLAILAHEAIALPLSPAFPASELRYILENSEAKIFRFTSSLTSKAEEVLDDKLRTSPLLSMAHDGKHEPILEDEKIEIDGHCPGEGGIMLYTSGTTSRPKGVLLPTSVIAAQARSLIEAWKYTNTDLLLHLLPLHHIHGAINGLFAPLMAGSAIEFLFPFNADATWKRLACPYLPVSAASSRRPITFLTAVPTIYDRLLQTHACLEQEVQEAARTAISPINLRLNMCGSAPLPTSIRADWTRLSHGNVLLERYGMTEVGMALSCGLDPADRVDGSVGWPLPSVEARLVDVETNQTILEGKELDQNGKEREGEIQLRGPTVFRQYWRNSKATEAEFVCDNDKGPKWFKTGDVATRKSVCGAGHSSQPWAKGPMYFIRGRKSVDIIKSGGEKVSALEVERELLSLPQVSEVVVVGIPSEKWGQKIVAVTVLNPVHAHLGKGGKRWAVMDMRRALRDKLANYKIPQELKVVASIPRNAMGKVNKKSLIGELFSTR